MYQLQCGCVSTCYRMADWEFRGGRSSARLERQVVALEVGGSSPLAHPTSSVVCVRFVRAPRTDLAHRTRHGTVNPRFIRYAGTHVTISSLRRDVLYFAFALHNDYCPSSSAGQSNGLLIRRSSVRIRGGALLSSNCLCSTLHVQSTPECNFGQN